MNRLSRVVFPAIFFLTVGVVVGIYVQRRGPAPNQIAIPGEEVSRRTPIVEAVERVSPTVVSVLALEPRLDQPFSTLDQSLQKYFQEVAPLEWRDQVPRFGSGIVIDSRGFFLTNHHLVGNAEEIWVTLPDGRQFAASVVGTDPNYDLAVIKVKEQGHAVFQTAPLGKAQDLMVGEWVVAVGNPYGYLLGDPKPSVSVGVVSALHRDVKVTEGSAIYKDMIQTDASINPGNSGGPLVNVSGEVVGISTFIISQNGGSLGLGFAIPIETAMELAGDIILYGKVRGVWIGLAVRGLDEVGPYVRSRLGIEDTAGIVVWTLDANSPAERAGIRLGDVIRTVNGNSVRDSEQARRAIFGARAGDQIEFQVERRGELLKIPVVCEDLPLEPRKEVP